MSLGSCGVIGCTRVRPRGRWVHVMSLGSLGCVLGVVGFIPGRCIRSGAPWRFFCSSGVVGFTCVSPRGHWVHPGSLGSFGCALGVVGFVWGHSRAPWMSLDSFGVVRFTRVRRWFNPESLGSLLCAQCVVEFVRGHWVLSSLGPSGSLGFHSGATWRSLGISGVVGFTCVRSGGRWVHPGSLGSHGFALWIVGFILGCRVHSHAPSGSLGSSGVVRYTRVRPGGRRFHPGVVGFTLVTPDCVLAHPV